MNPSNTWRSATCVAEMPSASATSPATADLSAVIAFERWGSRQTAARRTIYVMNADGSDERRLVPGGGHSSPVWAPNRPTLAFIRFDDSGRHLSLINANGSGLRTLTKGPGSGRLASMVS